MSEFAFKITSLAELPEVAVATALARPQRYTREPPRQVMVRSDLAQPYLAYYERRIGKLPEQQLFALPNHTLVMDKGSILIGEHLVRENLEGGDTARTLQALPKRDLTPVRTIEEPLLYVTRYGIKNYGHCLTDIVPRIAQALKVRPDLKVGIHPEFVGTALQALVDLGISEARWLALDEQPTLLKQGFFASACNSHPLVHCPTAISLLRSRIPALIQQAQHERPAAAGSQTRLFVTRDDASTRHLTNHAEIARALAEKGLEAVSTGRLSHAEQVRLFHQSTEIVAIAGAALTNMIYCRPGTRVTMLAPASMPALYFWDLAAQCGVDLRVGYFEATHPARGIHSDLRADLADVLALHSA